MFQILANQFYHELAIYPLYHNDYNQSIIYFMIVVLLYTVDMMHLLKAVEMGAISDAQERASMETQYRSKRLRSAMIFLITRFYFMYAL